jgi:hypothetical protein
MLGSREMGSDIFSTTARHASAGRSHVELPRGVA